MAILNHGSTLRTADGGQTTTTIVTAANIGTYGVATNSTYYVGTTQNVFNRASGAQTLTGVSIDGNAANITAYTINQNVGTANAPSFAGATLTSTLSITGGDGLRVFRAGAATVTSHIYWANTTNTVAYNWQLDENNNAAMWGYGGVGWANALTVTAAGSLRANGDVRAPIFYDGNDTAYYVDPNSISRLSSLRVYSAFDTASSDVYANMRVINDTAFSDGMYIGYANAGSGVTRLFGGGATSGALIKYSDYTVESNSFRAPIFYDSDNTAYYLDAANSTTSLLVAGKVGIGTVSPLGLLEVRGTNRLISNDGLLQVNSNNNAGIDLGGSISFGGVYASASVTEWAQLSGRKETATSGEYGGYLDFATRPHLGLNTSRIRITSTGNVGIGTTSPSNTKLHIVGDWVSGHSTIKTQTITSFASGGTTGIGLYDSDGTRSGYLYTNSTGTTVGSSIASPLIFETNGSERIRILSGGNVGIGTTSPANKLHVVGSAYSDTDFRAPIFYDSNDTGYFLNPNSTSNLNNLRAATISAANHGLTCVYYGGGATPTNGYLITTNIDYSTFNMPTVIIEGYAYGNGVPIHLEIVWYAYLNSWTNLAYTNLGNWNPGTVSIGTNASGKVCLHLSNLIYYGRFNVRCIYDQGNAPLEGWTVTDANTSALTRVTTISKVELATSITGNSATVTTNANLTGHITSVGNATSLGSFTSAQLLAALTDETGTGANVFATSPTLVTPALGTPSSGNLANCTFPTLNQNTTGSSASCTGNAATATNGLTTSNYVSYSAFTASLTSTVDARAPIFYDSNNTAYYIDGASGSKLKYLQIDGDWASSPFGGGQESFTIRSTYASMCQRQTNGALAYWLHHIPTDGSYMLYGGRGATDGSTWDWALKAYPNQDGNYVEFNTSARAQIFYDRNDTTYYTDPASTSRLNTLNVVGAVSAARGVFSNSSGSGSVIEAYNTVATNGTTAIFRQTTAGGNGNQDIGLLVDIQGANDLDRIANFRYYDGSTYTSRMAIMRGGNVGIGTTSPGAKLDVVGTLRTSANILSHKTASYTTSYPGINSFGADATDSALTYYDTGKLVANAHFRGVVWTGKHYIFTDHINNRAYFYDNNFVQIPNAYGYFFVTLPLPSGYASPHGAAWDGRYLWCVVYTGAASKIVGYDLDTTNQTATIIAESAAITAVAYAYDVEYADGHLYLVRSGTLFIYKWNGSSIDAVSNYPGAAGAIDAQAITYDGSYLWVTQNGTNIYKVGLDGTPLATITTITPNVCGWAWNGSNIVTFDYANRNIFIINTTRLRIDTQKLALMGGNVGIGTTSPTAPLMIYKASDPFIKVSGGGSLSYIQLDDGSSNGYLIKNISAGTGNGALAGALYTYTDSNKAFQHIHSGTPLFTILSGGNVGIGTTSPSQKFHVSGIGYSDTDFRAPIFYDSNDTAYYLDPRSASVLSGLKLNGIDNDAAGNTSDAILWINKPNNNDWGIRVTGNLEYLLRLEGATSHTYNIQGLANGSEFWRCGTDLLYHNSNIRAPIFYDNDNTAYYINAASTSNLAGLTVVNTITGSITGNAGGSSASCTGNAVTATTSINVSSPDGDRNPSTKLPTTNARNVRFDFAGAGAVGGAGNYAGVMTYAPWDGTSASTGDSSYQLAFLNETGVNASGVPGLSLRNGINSTWGSWYRIITSGNYNSYSPTLTGTGASGTWGINITGNAATATAATTINATSDITVNSITIGKGAGNIATNSALGVSALSANTTGTGNSAFGSSALQANTSGYSNGAFGKDALKSNTYGIKNYAFGTDSLRSNTFGSYSIAIGQATLYSNTTGEKNIAIGDQALYDTSFGMRNVAIGYWAMKSNVTGNDNNAVGYLALNANTTGHRNNAFGGDALRLGAVCSDNSAFGHFALRYSSGNNNCGFGANAGLNVTTATNNNCFGYNSQPSSATANNQITLGNSSISTLRCQVTTITALSDERDKTDIESLDIGLDFITKLKPVTFKWDKREWYDNGIRDGSKKESILQVGFIAQDLKKIQEETETQYLKLVLEDNKDKLEATPGNLLIPLIKAVQELNEKVKTLENKVRILENR